MGSVTFCLPISLDPAMGGIRDVLLLVRGPSVKSNRVAGGRIYIYFFFKFDLPRAKRIEPFKQLQVRLKTVPTRRRSQGLREVLLHRTELLRARAGRERAARVSLWEGFYSIWNRNVYPESIKILVRLRTLRSLENKSNFRWYAQKHFFTYCT